MRINVAATAGQAQRALPPMSLIFRAGAASAVLAVALAQPGWANPPVPSTPFLDPRLPSYAPRAGERGRIVVARTASMQGMVAAWARGFMAEEPGTVVVQTAASTDQPAVSLRELVSGAVEVAPFAREIQPGEAEAAARALGRAPLGIAVASGSYATPSNTHAIAIYVNAANPLNRMTMAQLDAIYSSTRRRGWPERIDRWGQLGLVGPWADRPIHAYGMVVNRRIGNPHSGIVAYLMDRLMLGGEFSLGTRQCPDTGMGRGKNRALDEIVRAVSADPDGIGYSGFANRIAGVKTLALAETADGPYYRGTPDEVARRVYPLTRTVFVFVRQPVSPVVRDFLLYALSRQGQASVARDPAGFLPLPAGFAALQRSRL